MVSSPATSRTWEIHFSISRTFLAFSMNNQQTALSRAARPIRKRDRPDRIALEAAEVERKK